MDKKREIKFRFYDKTDKRMKYFDSIWNMPDPSYDFDDIQQFTGLLDKNGVDIYEGDIVRSGKEYNYYTGLNSEIYGGRLYEIKNNGWRFYIEPHSLYDIDFKDLEVIGNIYENPELLKNN
jgi:uncharacterized phage protein (TIGR01671 family)